MMKMHQLWKNTVLALSMMLLSAGAFAQHEIKGTVLDESQLPIPGANVVIKGTTIGTITGGNGEFTMKANDGEVLVVSYIGYTNEEVTINGNGPYNVSLVPDMVGLSEVVVVGYGTQKKSDLTGSVASVRSDDLKKLSVTDAAAALQGKTSGVQILNMSGAPGQAASIRVRGYSSNSGNIGPLLIVDGLKVDNIQYLDPSMIESMEILKDAASAAIYGAEAGNGVVLITTKSGKDKGDGTITYSYKLTQNMLAKKPGVMNRKQYIDFQEQLGNAKVAATMEKYDDGKIDTDWADALFETSYSHQHSLTMQGGNQRGHYFLSLNSINNNGIIIGDRDVYKRLSAQINADYKIKDWLQVGTNTSIEKWDTKSVSHMSETNSVMGAVIQNDPLTPVYFDSQEDYTKDMQSAITGGNANFKNSYAQGEDLLMKDEDGKVFAVSQYVDTDNGSPLIQLYRQNATKEGISVRGTAFANLTPIKGLVYTSRLGYRITHSNEHNFSVPYFASKQAFSSEYNLTANANTGFYYQWENFINYNVDLGKNSIGAMVGMSFIENKNDNVNIGASGKDILKDYGENFRYFGWVADKTDEEGNSLVKKSYGNTPNRSASLAYFGRFTYSYDNRYSLQANFRADAFDSSKLSKSNRWGKFPSFSAGWTISNESFIKDNISQDLLSFLKVRASWGRNGNINVLNDYKYDATIAYNSQWYQYSVHSGDLSYGSQPSGLANPDLKWETSDQIDLGLDARLLNSRLSFGFDYYKKTTKDLLMEAAMNPEIGIEKCWVNGGEVENKGLEFELGWKDQIGDFHYNINANFSTLKNEVTYLDPSIPLLESTETFYVCKMRTAFEVGRPIWYMRGYEIDVNKEDGSIIEKDLNEDGQITEADMTMIGQGMPKYTYGLTINAEYKGFDLTIFGNGAGGNNIFPVLFRHDRTQTNTLAWYYENMWTEDNKNAKLPAASTFKKDKLWASNLNVFKGDYFKIKQIQLGYTLPSELTKKALIQNLRVFVSLEDYFTFTKYPGMDPETATTSSAQRMGVDLGTYPISKKMVFGVNVTF